MASEWKAERVQMLRTAADRLEAVCIKDEPEVALHSAVAAGIAAFELAQSATSALHSKDEA